MTRIQGILAAAGLTGVVLLATVLVGFRNLTQAATPAAAPLIQQQTSSSTDPSMQALLQEYQAQLEQANQTIRQLQAQRDQLAQMLSVQPSRGGEQENELEVDNE